MIFCKMILKVKHNYVYSFEKKHNYVLLLLFTFYVPRYYVCFMFYFFLFAIKKITSI